MRRCCGGVPGLAGPILAAPADDLVLYWGWPTQGTEVRWSSVGSRPGGRPLLTIKVAEPHSRSFTTLVPYLHPLRRISFGATPR